MNPSSSRAFSNAFRDVCDLHKEGSPLSFFFSLPWPHANFKFLKLALTSPKPASHSSLNATSDPPNSMRKKRCCIVIRSTSNRNCGQIPLFFTFSPMPTSTSNSRVFWTSKLRSRVNFRDIKFVVALKSTSTTTSTSLIVPFTLNEWLEVRTSLLYKEICKTFIESISDFTSSSLLSFDFAPSVLSVSTSCKYFIL